MRRLASFALAVALALPLAAQAADGSGGNPTSPLAVPGTSHLPLDAMLHHQPRAGDVARREGETGSNDQNLRRQKEELDALYNDIMARSAPKSQPLR